MVKVSGYTRIFSRLSSLETPTKKLLEVLIAMITEEEDILCLKDMKLVNSEPLVPFIHWMGELEPDEQVWLACTLEEVCTNSLQSKATACKSGVVVAVCQLMSSVAVDPRAATHLIMLVETLASYSVTARELKQLFLLLRTNQGKVSLLIACQPDFYLVWVKKNVPPLAQFGQRVYVTLTENAVYRRMEDDRYYYGHRLGRNSPFPSTFDC
ncbi:hypothetical protein J6590_036981 [Homalodisca vitripennis]|nr:hypothetical protein J6590_036981 [Homalodisca vitripennis]